MSVQFNCASDLTPRRNSPIFVDVVDDNGDYDDVVDDNGDSDYDADEFETLSHSVSKSPSCYE